MTTFLRFLVLITSKTDRERCECLTQRVFSPPLQMALWSHINFTAASGRRKFS